ncbi:30S ribosome-binding factor RbfA [bacterium]|nr:30S ribosome-binding factor RbfA [bacterium]
MKAKRTDRLASQVIREISDIIRRKLSDPRLEWVTITRVDVSPDMRDTKIFIRTLDSGEKQESTFEALRHASGFIKRELGNRLKWRVVPNLSFFRDEQAEQTENVLRIITELNQGGKTPDGGTEAGT